MGGEGAQEGGVAAHGLWLDLDDGDPSGFSCETALAEHLGCVRSSFREV